MFSTKNRLSKGDMMSKANDNPMPQTGNQRSSISNATTDADSMISDIDYSNSDKATLMLKIHSLMSEIGDQMSTPLNFISDPPPKLKSDPPDLISNPTILNLDIPLIEHAFFFGFKFASKRKFANHFKLKECTSTYLK